MQSYMQSQGKRNTRVHEPGFKVHYLDGKGWVHEYLQVNVL